jgi:hypothetical protein
LAAIDLVKRAEDRVPFAKHQRRFVLLGQTVVILDVEGQRRRSFGVILPQPEELKALAQESHPSPVIQD